MTHEALARELAEAMEEHRVPERWNFKEAATKAMLPIIGKYLAAAGVEEVVERIRNHVGCWESTVDYDQTHEHADPVLEQAIRAELASLPLPENVRDVLRECRKVMPLVGHTWVSTQTEDLAQQLLTRIDTLLGGDDERK